MSPGGPDSIVAVRRRPPVPLPASPPRARPQTSRVDGPGLARLTVAVTITQAAVRAPQGPGAEGHGPNPILPVPGDSNATSSLLPAAGHAHRSARRVTV